MVSIFTTKSSVENFYQEDNAWYKIICKLKEVHIDDDPFPDIDESVDPDENVFLTLTGMEVDIVDEREFINNIPNDPSSVLKYPCGIYLLDVSEEDASNIQKDYGVICQSINNLTDEPLTHNNFTTELEEGKKGYAWNDMLAYYKQLPSNSLLIVDAHLFENDRFDEQQNIYDPNRNVGLENLFDIINVLLPKQFSSEYHIGILLTDTDKAKAARKARTNLTNDRISKAIHRLKERIDRPYKDKLIIEVFFFDASDNDGHKIIHNRRILSNYFYVTAHYKLALLKKGRCLADDSITVFPLFENISNQPDSDKKEKRMRSDIRRFHEFFERQTRSISPTALFLQNNRKMANFKDIKHRLLRFSPPVQIN